MSRFEPLRSLSFLNCLLLFPTRSPRAAPVAASSSNRTVMYRLDDRPRMGGVSDTVDGEILSTSPTMDSGTAVSQFASASVYCNDALLRVLQLAPWRPYQDSKTIVDLPLKRHPSQVLDSFADYLLNPNVPDAQSFLADNFHDSPDKDTLIGSHIPRDFTKGAPLFTNTSSSACLREFAEDLNNRWISLARAFTNVTETDTPRTNQYERLPDNPYSSLIPLPYPFFIPGGRFRECYYWDTLWIVYGLLECDMLESAMGVVRNLLYLAENFGFVPNGTRVYYLNRSQPPVLAECVSAIFDKLDTHEQKRDWLIETVPILEKEYSTFMKCRRAPPVDGKQTPLCIYSVKTTVPRPESYTEDIVTAAESVLKRSDSKSRLNGPEMDTVTSLILDSNKGTMEQMYEDIASGAESGWDFSSRWFGSEEKGLSSIKTSKIVPVCLNSILLRAEKLLANFHDFLDNQETSHTFTSAAEYRSECMHELMWNPITQLWMDYDLERECQTDAESAAGLMPLWADAVSTKGWSFEQAEQFVTALNASKLMGIGGLATTTTNSSHEQWDFPNVWAPLVDVAVVGLRNLEEKFPGCGARTTAINISLRTLRTMYKGWKSNQVMHEKYDARKDDGSRGEGGEYEPQVGFGWTNGVALKLMAMYADEIEDGVFE